MEELKGVASGDRQEFEKTVQDMFETFIAADSPLAINIDHDTRTDIIDRVQSHTPDTFPHNIYERAQVRLLALSIPLLRPDFHLSIILSNSLFFSLFLSFHLTLYLSFSLYFHSSRYHFAVVSTLDPLICHQSLTSPSYS